MLALMRYWRVEFPREIRHTLFPGGERLSMDSNNNDGDRLCSSILTLSECHLSSSVLINRAPVPISTPPVSSMFPISCSSTMIPVVRVYRYQ